jgi:hypothetical protein
MWWWVLPTGMAVVAAGCSTHSRMSADDRFAIQASVSRSFDRVSMSKPDEVSAASHPLAPLLLLENSGEDAASALPVEMFSWPNQAYWFGKPAMQVSFVWKMPRAPLNVQGVRMTLDEKGMPVIWEVLRDSTGMRVIYVGQSLEAEAMRQHPQPLPGHRFWIEPGRSDTSVIARVLDETNVPMGPIVYLEASTGTVSTIICRCMPAQAGDVVGVQSYAVREMSANAWKSLPASLRGAARDWSPLCPPPEMSGLFRLKPD